MKKTLFWGSGMLFLFIFTACSPKQETKEIPVTEKENGHYQEETVVLPKDSSPETVLQLYQENDGIYLGYFSEKEDLQWFQMTEDEQFVAVEEEWQKINERGSVADCFLAEKGKRYVLRRKNGEKDSYSVEVWKDNTDVTVLELELPAKVYFERIYGDKEGNILLFSPQEGYLFKAGETKGEKVTVAGSCGYSPLGEEKLIVSAGLGRDYGILNLQTGEFEGKLSPDEVFQKNTLLSSQLAKWEDNWYFLTSQGIYVLKSEAEKAELLVDAKATSIFLSDFQANSMVCKNGEIFWVCTGKEIYRYRWTEEPFIEKKQLTLISCEELPALRDAVVKFNLQHSDTEISYDTLLPANYTVQEKAEAVKTLNTQIMAGEGSDIFILNGLPLESYEKKGLLLDLKETLTPVLQEESYYGTVISGYEKEGKLFAPVVSFIPLLHLVNKDGCLPDSLQKITAWLETNEEASGLSAKFYKEPNREFFRKTVYQFYQSELKNENGTLEKERIRSYIEAEKLLYDRIQQNGKENADDISRGLPMLHDILYRLMREEDGNFGCLIGLERELVQNVNPFREDSWDYQCRQQYVPGLVAGVSSQSSSPEEAKAFVRFLFEEEIQNVIGNGYELPVSKNSLKNSWEEIRTSYEEMYGEQYEMKAFPGFPVYVITKEEIASYIKLFEKAEQPVEYLFGSRNSEPEEFKLFYERSEGYFDGIKSLEKTTEEVYEGLQTLESERE